MKKRLILLAIGLILLPMICDGAQTAQARLHCRSLRVDPGRATDAVGERWSLDMTTLATGVNGELAPDFLNSGYSNSTHVEMTWRQSTFLGVMFLDIPSTGDANGNGFPDFFEVSQAVSETNTSLGAYQFENASFGSGTCTVYWAREAGSAVGDLAYTIPNPLGGNLTFFHQFTVIEYDGQLDYTPGTTNVAGVLSITETNSGNTLLGPVTFVKSVTNRFNQLTFQSAFLTNAALQTLNLYTNTTILRRTANPTNYFGPVEFNDGDPNTAEKDYHSWWIFLDDPNDTDHDTIPDFSDDPPSSLPRRPVLALARGTTNLLLTISGDVGRLHYILESTNLPAGNWLTNLSLTLTNDPQTVSFPLPPGGLKFWRARAE